MIINKLIEITTNIYKIKTIRTTLKEMIKKEILIK